MPNGIKDIAEKWLLFCDQRHSQRTRALYAIVIKRFCQSAPADIRDLTLEHIENYLLSLSHLANTTVNAHLTALKSFGRWCEDRQLPNPAKKVKWLPEHSKQRILTQGEYEKILAVCAVIERDIIEFLAHTGLRAGEFLSLSRASLSPDRRFLYVVGKGQKPRTAPLNQICRFIIDRHPDLYFAKNYMCLYRLCHSLARRAGVLPFGPHALRHYFATRLMQAGISVYRISKILGHSSIAITEKIYIHFLARNDLADITECLV